MPKVTIGMPTFNRANYLKRSIEQVLLQTYSDFEFIIYDDGSTDKTVEVVNSFKDSSIIFINGSNKGLPYPLNKILELAKGEYIIILHDHDIFNPELIEKSVIALDEHPEVGFVFQGNAWINTDGITGYKEFLHDLPLINDGIKFGKQLLMQKDTFSSPLHACSMVRKSAYEKVGKYYDEKFGWYCDLDLWLRLLKKYDFVYLKEVLFTFTGRETNHLLNKKTWQVNEWLYETHRKHIPAFFEDDKSIKLAEEILNDKRSKAGKKTMVHALFAEDKVYLEKSIMEYSKYDMNKKLKRLILKVLAVKPLQPIILNAGTFMQFIRKRIIPKVNLI